MLALFIVFSLWSNFLLKGILKLFGVKSIPLSLSIISDIPPLSNPITGVPHKRGSNTVLGKLSARVGLIKTPMIVCEPMTSEKIFYNLVRLAKQPNTLSGIWTS